MWHNVERVHRPAPHAGGGAQPVVSPRQSNQTVFDKIHAKHQHTLQERLAAVAALPEAEQDAARQKVNEEAPLCVVVAVF